MRVKVQPVSTNYDFDGWTPGVTKEGRYDGARKVQCAQGAATLYLFTDPEGTPFEIWAYTDLRLRMEEVAKGAHVFVTFLGEVPVPPGRPADWKPRKDFDVEVDSEPLIIPEEAA